MSVFFKSVKDGFVKGMLFFLFLFFSLVVYAVYSFKNFLFLFPVVSELNTENTAILITLHNESELRPTLGFLTGFILLKKDASGNFSLEFHDSYDVLPPQEPIVAPDIIEENFSTDSRYQGWVFRDSNFDMRYVQNAKNAIAFLQYDDRYKDVNISAVVSLDMHVVESVLDSIGGVYFDGEYITGENFFSVLESRSKQFDRGDEEAWKNRKGSIKPLAIQIAKKSLKSVLLWGDISSVVHKEFSDGHILLYSPRLKIQEVFYAHGLSGVMELDSSHISWGVNIANIGGKKGDRYVDKSIRSLFSIGEDGVLREKINIDFVHNGTRNLHSDRYFAYVRVVKPKNTKLVRFNNSENFMKNPSVRNATFPGTSEFDFFVFIDPSLKESVELEFLYDEAFSLSLEEEVVLDVFMQPGLLHVLVDFAFQSFADESTVISGCSNVRRTENVSRCSFVVPYLFRNISVMRKKDTTLPLFEDVVYKEGGRIIRLQFSEDLEYVDQSQVVLLNGKDAVEITSVKNIERGLEIVLVDSLPSDERIFYTVLIDNLSDKSGNSLYQYNETIAYPKYK